MLSHTWCRFSNDNVLDIHHKFEILNEKVDYYLKTTYLFLFGKIL